MKHPTLMKFSRRALHDTLFLIFVFLLAFSAAHAAPFQAGDTVKLLQDTPLIFLDKPLRQGPAGEAFEVLAYQSAQKKVFLAAKDPAGKQIAVSVSEDAVALVPADKAKVQAEVLAAIEHQQFGRARTLLDQALRASPDEVDLHSTSIALDALVQKAQRLNQVLATQKTLEADLVRQRRNADVTDHPNPLDASDNSGRQRASQIRAEANRIEKQSNQAVRTAQTDYDAALSALKVTMQRPVSKPSDQASREVANAQKLPLDDSLKKWTDDEAVVPTRIIESDPGFRETISFLNGKLAPSKQKIWFGKAAQKMIIEDADGVVLFDPSDLSPSVLHGDYGDQFGRHYYVELKTTNSRDKFQFLWKSGSPAEMAHRMTVNCEDKFDAEKVASAFSHLISMFGGKKDSF